MKTYNEWETFAKYELGYDDDEAATYAMHRLIDDQNRAILEHKTYVSGYEPVRDGFWDE